MTASAVILAMLVGTGMALLVNRKFFGRGVVRTLLITPFLIMPVATDLMFKTTIYDPVFGFLDYVLKPFGVGQVNWLGTHAVGSIVVVLGLGVGAVHDAHRPCGPAGRGPGSPGSGPRGRGETIKRSST